MPNTNNSVNYNLAAMTSTGITKYDGTTLVTSTTAKIDSSNRQTNTSQPCFLVHLNTTISNVTGDGTLYSVLFDTTIFDNASNITLNSGGKTIFTAPVTGRYKFDTGIVTAGSLVAGNNAAQVRLTATSRYFTNFFDANQTAAPTNIISCIVDMTAADTCFVQLYVPGVSKVVGLTGQATNPVCWFSGVLLC